MTNNKAYCWIVDFIEQGNWLSLLLLVASLPFSMLFIRIFWYIWFVTWVAEWLLKLKFLQKPQLTNRKTLIPFIGFAIWCLWNWLSLIWSIDTNATWCALGREWHLICLILVMLWGVNKYYSWQTILKVLVYSALTSVFVYLLVHYWVVNSARALDKFYPTIKHLNLLTMDNLLLETKHRLHYANILQMALVALFMLFNDRKQRFSTTQNIFLTLLATAWLLLGIFWCGSRIAWISLLAITAIFIVTKINKKWRIVVAISALAIGIFAGVLINTFRPRDGQFTLQERLYYNPQDTLAPSNEIRIAIWHTVFENKQDYPFYGLGDNCSQEYLTEKYAEKGWINHHIRRFSTHNQYLALWMELGPFAVVFFISIWLLLPCYFNGRAKQWSTSLATIFLIAMTTENIFSSQEGIMIASVLLLIIFLLSEDINVIPYSDSDCVERKII